MTGVPHTPTYKRKTFDRKYRTVRIRRWPCQVYGRSLQCVRSGPSEAVTTIRSARENHAHELEYKGKITALEKIMDSSLVKRDPEIMSGALCFAGTRVPVKNLFDYLEGSSSLEEFLKDFPSVSRETAVAVLEAARERLAVDASAA